MHYFLSFPPPHQNIKLENSVNEHLQLTVSVLLQRLKQEVKEENGKERNLFSQQTAASPRRRIQKKNSHLKKPKAAAITVFLDVKTTILKSINE